MEQRVDSSKSFTVPGRVQRTIQQSWTIRTGEAVRMPRSLAGQVAPGHGHAAWAMPFAATNLIQPQDGADNSRTTLQCPDERLHEAEDAHLTGGTRSLNRRLLGLNIVQDYLKRENARVTSLPSRMKADVA